MITCAKALSSRLHADLGADDLRADLAGDAWQRARRSACSPTATPTPAIRSPRRWRSRRSPSTRSATSSATSAQWRRSCRTACARLADHPLVGEARGVGLVGALELVSDKATRQPFSRRSGVAAPSWRKRAEAHGADHPPPGRRHHRLLAAADHRPADIEEILSVRRARPRRNLGSSAKRRRSVKHANA